MVEEVFNMKKICYITTVSSTIKAFFLETLDILSRNGYDVTVICNEDPELNRQIPQGVRYIPIYMERGISPWNGLRAIWQLRRIFVQEKFDLIQYSTPNAAFYASIAGKIAGINLKVYHNMGFVFLSFTGIKKCIFSLLEKITCRFSDKVQFVSKSNLSFALRSGLTTEEKAYIVWNGSSGGINLDRFNVANKQEHRQQIRRKYQIENDSFIFGFVGRITKDKGIEELFTAYQNLRNNHDYSENLKLMIIGPEENLDGVEKNLIKASKEDPTIIFCGAQNEIEKFYSAMDVLVHPSYREGFGNVIIEAEAMGVPVIASDIPGPSDIVVPGETGILCKRKDAEELERSMSFMLEHRNLLSEYGLNGVRFATENYDSKVLVKKILDDKNKLLRNN